MSKYLSSTMLAVVLLVALVLGCIFILNLADQSTLDRVEWCEETYRVRTGDTLWVISGLYCPDNVDRWEWIDEVQTRNGIHDTVIQPGWELTVLAPVGEG